jgi:hypothetical protein
MEIGPITALRPVTMIKPSTAAPDLSRVFEVEYLGQSNDDAYTPGNRKGARGLEDEDDVDLVEDSPADETSSGPVPPTTKINFFA